MKKSMMTAAMTAALLGAAAMSTCAEEIDIMDQMREANLNETLQMKGEPVAYRIDIYDAEGNIYSSYAYLDQNMVVTEMDGSVTIMEGDTVYGFNNDSKEAFTCLFLDDAFDNYSMPVTGYSWDPKEVCIETYEEDGEIVVHTEGGSEESLSIIAAELESLGYVFEEQPAVMYEYRLDADTCEINSAQTLVFLDGSEGITYMTGWKVEDPQPYEVAEEILDELNSNDSRYVSVILDPDTESETEIACHIGKGCSVAVYTSWLHPELYTDRECTQLFEGNDDRNTDIQLYSVRADETTANPEAE